MRLFEFSDYWTLVMWVIPALTIYASVIDYRERRVPNWLNGSLVLSGIVAQVIYFGPMGGLWALAGAGVGFGLLILPWAMHGMGAGDVKLMAGIGAWFGWKLTLVSGCVGMLIGGVMALVIIGVNRRWREAQANFGVIMTKMTSPGTAFSEFGSVKSFGSTTTLLPYGIPLTIGSLIMLAVKYFGEGWAL
jgi:prepilin peptidase CpaA